MSGHSKWSQIKHKKALTDKKKGQIFSKLSKLITLTAKRGTDPKSNPELAQIIEQARAVNMPRDNIERAVKKVSDKFSDSLEELSIDAMGPGGIALRIKATTDNRNRTIAEIKAILAEHESKMVPPGSISWMFQQPHQSPDEDTKNKIGSLFEALDEQDEVEDVSSNFSLNWN